VALLQTQTTLEETIGTAVSRNGMAYARTPEFTAARLPYTNSNLNTAYPVPAAPTPPHPGAAYCFQDPRIDPTKPGAGAVPAVTAMSLWNSVKQNLIVADDKRYAFVPMYIRSEGSNFAKVIVIGVRVRNTPEFTEDDLERTSAAANLEPRPVNVTLEDNTGEPNPADTITITAATGNLGPMSTSSNAPAAAAEGAYVIISEDSTPDDTATPFTNEHGQLNGRVYRLGAQRTDLGTNVFELAAGEDMASDLEDMTDAQAFIVGRGYTDPADPSRGYSGPSMAVQRYESVIALP
jgi:hypothetical protein